MKLLENLIFLQAKGELSLNLYHILLTLFYLHINVKTQSTVSSKITFFKYFSEGSQSFRSCHVSQC